MRITRSKARKFFFLVALTLAFGLTMPADSWAGPGKPVGRLTPIAPGEVIDFLRQPCCELVGGNLSELGNCYSEVTNAEAIATYNFCTTGTWLFL